jgi:hypothetical protein
LESLRITSFDFGADDADNVSAILSGSRVMCIFRVPLRPVLSRLTSIPTLRRLGAASRNIPLNVFADFGQTLLCLTVSASCSVLRALVDPNRAAMRSQPRDDRDVFIAGNNGHVIGIDNLSGLPTWMSNALCRISTGGGYATRLLYSDDDEAIFDVRIPVILTGIGNYITRSDLADRALRFVLEAIPDTARRSDNEFWEAFDAAHPKIFGVLLDGVVRGLNEFAHVNLERKPRMADFAIWGVACEGAFWEKGTFMRAHDVTKADLLEDLIDADPVARAVRKFIDGIEEWSGTATELLNALNVLNVSDERDFILMAAVSYFAERR